MAREIYCSQKGPKCLAIGPGQGDPLGTWPWPLLPLPRKACSACAQAAFDEAIGTRKVAVEAEKAGLRDVLQAIAGKWAPVPCSTCAVSLAAKVKLPLVTVEPGTPHAGTWSIRGVRRIDDVPCAVLVCRQCGDAHTPPLAFYR